MNFIKNKKLNWKMRKSSRAVVFGITKDLDFALGAMIVGFLKHNQNYDGHFVVFHDGISQEQQDVFRAVCSAISFRRFEEEAVRKRLAKVMEHQSASKIIDRYSHLYFAKFEIFDLLDEFERVIWMDVDMLVRGPLHDLWDFDDFCWREIGVDALSKQKKAFNCFSSEIGDVPFRSGNGGLIGVSGSARGKGPVVTQLAFEFFAEYVERSGLVHGDEFAPFLIAARNKCNVRALPLDFNCPSATTGAQNAKIVHAIGNDKFWNNHALKLAYPDWWMWYDEWVRLGGRKTTAKLSGGGAVKTPNGLVYSARFEHHWKSLFASIWGTLPMGFIPDVLMHRKFYQIFLTGFPQRQVHIEITKLDKGFELGVHIEGEAVEDINLIHDISNRMATLSDYERADHKYGLGWRVKCDPSTLSGAVIRLATALQDLEVDQR